MGRSPRSPARPAGHRDRGLLLIASFKLLKAAVLVAAGVAALELLRPGAAHTVEGWLASLPLHSQRDLAQRALARVTGLSERRLRALGAASFAYAALFVVEGIGLWRQRRWAEYLTVAATASFLPLEVYELAQRTTAVRFAALAGNLAVVAYLLWALRRGRRRPH